MTVIKGCLPKEMGVQFWGNEDTNASMHLVPKGEEADERQGKIQNVEHHTHEVVGMIHACVGRHGKNAKWCIIVAVIMIEARIVVVIRKGSVSRSRRGTSPRRCNKRWIDQGLCALDRLKVTD